MFKQDKTDKYIKNYLKKHYPKRKNSHPLVSASIEILGKIAQEIGDFADFYREFKDWDFNPFPVYSVYTPVYKRPRYRSGVASLERGGFVRWNKNTQTVSLTEKGIQEILKYKMRNKHFGKPWDGKWRVIIFDIKEETRRDRNYLRGQLRWIGFQELQKSVWVFPYEIRDELKEFMRLCKFDFYGDVKFMLVDKIDSDDALRKSFNLL